MGVRSPRSLFISSKSHQGGGFGSAVVGRRRVFVCMPIQSRCIELQGILQEGTIGQSDLVVQSGLVGSSLQRASSPGYASLRILWGFCCSRVCVWNDNMLSFFVRGQ